MEVFVNKAIENGIQAFVAKNEGKDYSIAHEFELNIINFLSHLYGKLIILNSYKIKDEESFRNNIMVHGASEEDVDTLFNLMDEYDRWLSSTSRDKNDLLARIYALLAKLVIYKTGSTNISDGEMRYYLDFFALTNKRMNQLADMMAANKDEVVNALDRAKTERQKELDKPKPEPLLLPEDEYEKYGVYLDEVEKLPEDKIRELNKEIKRRDENETSGGTSKDKPKHLVLSSGNGFVDALVLFSIVCTEIMVGIVITVIIARF